jgi:hypothetical protein
VVLVAECGRFRFGVSRGDPVRVGQRIALGVPLLATDQPQAMAADG